MPGVPWICILRFVNILLFESVNWKLRFYVSVGIICKIQVSNLRYDWRATRPSGVHSQASFHFPCDPGSWFPHLPSRDSCQISGLWASILMPQIGLGLTNFRCRLRANFLKKKKKVQKGKKSILLRKQSISKRREKEGNPSCFWSSLYQGDSYLLARIVQGSEKI
jgi:hypothetical protein